MPRYIDADILKDLYQPIDGKDYNVNMAIIRANIDDIPTADVQEVKHGKWEQCGKLEGKTVLKCSQCSQGITERFSPKYFYCPNCGAKMDGDNK